MECAMSFSRSVPLMYLSYSGCLMTVKPASVSRIVSQLKFGSMPLEQPAKYDSVPVGAMVMRFSFLRCPDVYGEASTNFSC